MHVILNIGTIYIMRYMLALVNTLTISFCAILRANYVCYENAPIVNFFFFSCKC